jgi:carboxymethylenebutenolidase
MKLELEQDIRGLYPDKEFDRRDFIWTALGASAALAAAGTVSAQEIDTDTNGLVAGDVEVPVKDGKLPAYRAMPATGGPFAVVLVVPEVFGNNHYVKDVCRRLAKAGYFAIAPDIYARKADLTTYKNIADIMPIVNSKADTELVSDFDATAAYAGSTGKGDLNRLGITGFCRGGRTVWMYVVHNPKMKAAVSWYGSLSGQKNEAMAQHPLDVVDQVKVPVLGLYGGKDAGIPQDQVEKMRAGLKAGATPSEIIVYPNSGHGFNADFRPDSYNKVDSEDAWKRMLAWFKKYGVA